MAEMYLTCPSNTGDDDVTHQAGLVDINRMQDRALLSFRDAAHSQHVQPLVFDFERNHLVAVNLVSRHIDNDDDRPTNDHLTVSKESIFMECGDIIVYKCGGGRTFRDQAGSPVLSYASGLALGMHRNERYHGQTKHKLGDAKGRVHNLVCALSNACEAGLALRLSDLKSEREQIDYALKTYDFVYLDGDSGNLCSQCNQVINGAATKVKGGDDKTSCYDCFNDERKGVLKLHQFDNAELERWKEQHWV